LNSESDYLDWQSMPLFTVDGDFYLENNAYYFLYL